MPNLTPTVCCVSVFIRVHLWFHDFLHVGEVVFFEAEVVAEFVEYG